MIDIHCHILPWFDDGAKDLVETIAMANKAAEEGITKIIATPHYKKREFENSKEKILQAVESLNKELSQHKIPLTILPGQEPRIYGEILHDYNKGEILTLNNGGKYLFVEFPSGHVPRYAEQLLFDIQLNGLTPIIVHPERNSEIMENPDLLYKFVKNGTCSQITSSSVTGHFGKNIKKFTMQLVESNLTHFVASDSHDLSSRPFRMREAYSELVKEFGTGVEYFFKENAEMLIEGKTIIKETPEKVKKKRLFGIF
ncbi:tyrosine-protein phosphatase [Bacillus sp. REN16]|uniref:tyrosine-protein phosphatase n=1 Tax=Bacillus sp. REN16 TaxID=2887296 RepID=UPI001E4767EB|nr:CpsB/CapC family capsule biosynthesis tyrosine phosphatase [Bacillus sp. REN16]MCC3356093.1 tyrosine protein phosphatase [Bacillus sp. REN16]